MFPFKKVELVADFRTAMKWGSMKLGVIAAVIAGYVAMYPGVLLELSRYLPEPYRPVGTVLISAAAFGVIYLVRNTKKKDA